MQQPCEPNSPSEIERALSINHGLTNLARRVCSIPFQTSLSLIHSRARKTRAVTSSRHIIGMKSGFLARALFEAQPPFVRASSSSCAASCASVLPAPPLTHSSCKSLTCKSSLSSPTRPSAQTHTAHNVSRSLARSLWLRFLKLKRSSPNALKMAS